MDIVWSVKDKSISAHYLDAGAAEFFIQTRIKKEIASAIEDSNTDQQMKETGTKSRKRRKYGLLEVPAEELGEYRVVSTALF